MSATFDWLDALHHRTRVEASIVAMTGLRIGRGRSLDAVETDLPILRDREDRPFIPGSSLKGVLRMAGERLLRGWMAARPAGRPAARPAARPEVQPGSAERTTRAACDPLMDPCTKSRTDESEEADLLSSLDRLRAIHEELEKNACLMCATFGAARLASHVLVRDARPVGLVRTSIRDGVAIDRDLARVSGGKKYDFEVVEPGSTFQLQLDLQNDRDWQLGLVLVCLDRLADGTARIGGFGSRGLGAVELRDLKVVRRTVEQVVGGVEGTPIDREQLQRCRTSLMVQLEALA